MRTRQPSLHELLCLSCMNVILIWIMALTGSIFWFSLLKIIVFRKYCGLLQADTYILFRICAQQYHTSHTKLFFAAYRKFIWIHLTIIQIVWWSIHHPTCNFSSPGESSLFDYFPHRGSSSFLTIFLHQVRFSFLLELFY